MGMAKIQQKYTEIPQGRLKIRLKYVEIPGGGPKNRGGGLVRINNAISHCYFT
jgi:hypothetical protein